MTENTAFSLLRTMMDSQKDLIVLFQGESHILTNTSFNKFFGTSSLEEYNGKFRNILDNFVPHPSYFHKGKAEPNVSWMDSILKLDEINRIVSMMTPTFEPRAFSVKIDICDEEYKVVTFTDITQDLVKRIMIENHANIDKNSGAYDKKYFIQISKSYEDAATFNEKILGMILVAVDTDENPDFAYDEKALGEFVNHFKAHTRQDDMLVRWDEGKFLLVFLVDNEQNAQQMTKKLKVLVESAPMKNLGCSLISVIQKEGENVQSLLSRVNSQD